MSQKVPTKDVRAIVEATFPEYRKHNVIICPTTSVTMHDLNWSGGTKSTYRACTIDGKPVRSKVDTGIPAPWNNPYEGLTVDLPENVVIVKGGYFCGKTSTLCINVHPANMPRFITER